MSDKYSFKNDIWKSLILTIILVGVFFFIKNKTFLFGVYESSPYFIGIFISLLGFIITAVTILLMFDSDKNNDLKKLKDAGYYSQMIERFVSATFIIFFGIIMFGMGALIGKDINYYVKIFFEFFLSWIVTLTAIRIYRSLNILNIIYKLVYKKPKNTSQ